ncbi:MAG: hypothetical protein JO030_08860 [Candidatus Eremiobacteraeota bacterium]|nr:hypothetical protein [Candidatus Eremiobacteraeota bacterium]
MFDVADSLRAPLDAAAGELHAAQRAVAEANASGGRFAAAAMARSARAAVFTEALLAAAHARFEELKAVAK